MGDIGFMVHSVAPGKIIIIGEYVGIFGEPVTLTTVNLFTNVEIEAREDNRILISSDRFPGEALDINYDDLILLWNEAKSTYQKYLSNLDGNILRKYRSKQLLPLSLAVGAGLFEVKNHDRSIGFNLTVKSILPVGSGLGSSASMCASVIGAILNYYKCEFDLTKLNNLTFEVEKILNGKPSGGDNSAVVFGGWLRFQRINDELKVDKLNGLGETKNWWLIDGGKPCETTLDLIDKVLTMKKTNEQKVKELISRDRIITELVQKQIKEGFLHSDFLTESQCVLEEFGVIGDRGKKIVEAVRQSGGNAKVSGAGGIKDGVGTILCYHGDEEKLKVVAKQHNFRYSPVILGGTGWKIEK